MKLVDQGGVKMSLQLLGILSISHAGSSFTNKKPIEKNLSLLSQVKQSQTREYTQLYGNFSFKFYCLFWSTPVTSERTKNKEDSFKVKTRDFQNTPREVCEKRNDDWSGTVVTRILAASANLQTADIVYHKSGFSKFLTEFSILHKYSEIPSQSWDNKNLIHPRIWIRMMCSRNVSCFCRLMTMGNEYWMILLEWWTSSWATQGILDIGNDTWKRKYERDLMKVQYLQR